MKKLHLLWCSILALPICMVAGQFQELKDDIEVVATLCNPTDVLVDADGWQLTAADFYKRGYKPVRVCIENKSGKSISIYGKSVVCPVITREQLIKQFGHNFTRKALIALVVANGICIPFAVLMSLVHLSKKSLVFLKLKSLDFQLYIDAQQRISVFLKLGGREIKNGVFQNALSKTLVKYADSLTALCVGGVLGVNLISLWMYYPWLGQNRKLAKLLSDFLFDDVVTIESGSSVQKIMLLPQDAQGSIPFSIFHAEDQSVLQTFYINCA